MLDAQTKDVRLIDFGHSELVHPEFVLNYTCGTKGYRAPEAKPGRRCLPQSDLYSAGVILLHLLVPHLFPRSVLNPSEEASVTSILESWKLNSERKPLLGIARTNAKAKAKTSGQGDPVLGRLCAVALCQTHHDPHQRTYFGVETSPVVDWPIQCEEKENVPERVGLSKQPGIRTQGDARRILNSNE
jgi:serine/threonine protein kinase